MVLHAYDVGRSEKKLLQHSQGELVWEGKHFVWESLSLPTRKRKNWGVGHIHWATWKNPLNQTPNVNGSLRRGEER